MRVMFTLDCKHTCHGEASNRGRRQSGNVKCTCPKHSVAGFKKAGVGKSRPPDKSDRCAHVKIMSETDACSDTHHYLLRLGYSCRCHCEHTFLLEERRQICQKLKRCENTQHSTFHQGRDNLVKLGIGFFFFFFSPGPTLSSRHDDTQGQSNSPGIFEGGEK